MRKPITPERIQKLNRRQRKKFHVGEFQELIFEVTARFREPAGETAYDAFVDALCDFVEQRDLGLSMFTGIYPVWQINAIIAPPGRGTATDDDHQAVLDWLKAQPGVQHVDVADMADMADMVEAGTAWTDAP